MFKNYLKITLRNTLNHKGYSFINISGLAVGMACCILIFLWVQDELGFDSFHKNYHQLCRAVQYQHNKDGAVFPVAVTSGSLGPAFKDEYPEVLEYVRYRPIKNVLIRYKDKKFFETGFTFADPSLFKIFTFPFLQGDPESALADPYSLVITKRMAEKYFQNTDPIGKSINFGSLVDFIVSGVIDNVPLNSHLQFDFIGPFETVSKKLGLDIKWHNNYYYTYLLLDKNTDVEILTSKIRYYIKKIQPQSTAEFGIQLLKDIHLRSNYAIDLKGHSEIQSVYVTFFSAIAIFVLIIACINFMNLTTARSANRAKEIAMRKVSGAKRSDIARQFFGESFVVAIFSLVLALFLVALSIPFFNTLSGKQLNVSSFLNLDIILGILGITLITGFLSGFYPSLLLSSFKPVGILKGVTGSDTKGSYFRRILVIIQFSLSLILIIGTMIVYQQLDFIQNRKLGYNKDHMIYISMQGNLQGEYRTFKEEMLKNPNILGVTASSDLPTYTVHSCGRCIEWEGMSPEDHFLIHWYAVDHDFIETFGIEMAAGRSFSKAFSTDSSEGFILNEEAVKQMGIKTPVGKKFQLFGNKGVIIGVMKNFHFKSLHERIEPLVFYIKPQYSQYVFARISSERIKESLDLIERIHQRFNPGDPLDYGFLDEEIDNLYRVELRTRQIFQYFTILAILISCIGLFGLATFMAEKRTKEIGIRKVMGASISGIVLLLSKDITRWILLANIIGWPLAFLVMKNWLQNFAYRITPGIWTFILSGLLVLFIALFTIIYQAVKAATANPIDSLRYE